MNEPALYAHPFSSYCWKVLIPLYERDLPFAYKRLDEDAETLFPELAALWPLGKFPLLVDGDRVIMESTPIIEYLDRTGPEATRMIPPGTDEAFETRLMDRIFDNHVMTPMNQIVYEHLLASDAPDAARIDRARQALATIYDWLEQKLAGREWATGDRFTLADCAAAPSLFYADWVAPIGTERPVLAAYRARLLARPSVARVVDEARPFRHFFPPGAPDRD